MEYIFILSIISMVLIFLAFIVGIKIGKSINEVERDYAVKKDIKVKIPKIRNRKSKRDKKMEDAYATLLRNIDNFGTDNKQEKIEV